MTLVVFLVTLTVAGFALISFYSLIRSFCSTNYVATYIYAALYILQP